MQHPSRVAVGAFALTALSAAAFAQQAPKPEQLIKWRQSTFQSIAWNTGRIKNSIEGDYNKDDVIRSANAIVALANAGIGSLFIAGTEQGKGWHDTSAKAELFTNAQRFSELSANFGHEAGELARVAPSGDQAQVKAQFSKLTATCKGCHDEFRAKD